MAIHTPPEPPQYEPPGDYKNAKAQAKAAKAYAKSQRPWYKKKRFILSGGLVLLVVAVSSGSSGGGGTSDSQSSGSGGSSSDGKSGKVGQALTNAGTTYKVTNVRTTDKIGDPDLGGARADGMFVVVALELTNNKNETKTFLDSSAKIQTSDGKKYETSDKAVLSFGDQSLLLKDIQPDLTTRGKLAFELPASKVNGSTLLLEDLFGSGEIEINLGL